MIDRDLYTGQQLTYDRFDPDHTLDHLSHKFSFHTYPQRVRTPTLWVVIAAVYLFILFWRY
jgi:hypothetical protein